MSNPELFKQQGNHKMKTLIATLLIALSFTATAAAPSVDSIAFAVKHTLDNKLFQSPKFESGERFQLGKGSTMGYRLFFSGKYQGRKSVMQVNCTADIPSGKIKQCKPVGIK